MIVVPVIFFSLVVGAASLPISKFGRIGLKTLGWYLSCSALAAIVGVCLALLINPGSGTDLEQWQQMAGLMETEAHEIAGQAQTEGTLSRILLNLFRNPFEALGINPILDMFETMNNVTGDLVCTFAVAHNEGLVDET